MSKEGFENSGVEEFSKIIGQLSILRGVIGILFGVFALVWPGLTLVTLGILLSIWLLVSGVSGIISSIFMRREQDYWFLKLLVSVLELGVGAYIVQRPGVSVATVVVLIAIVLISEGVIDVIGAMFAEDADASMKALAMIGGVLSVIAGIVVWRYPIQGTLAFVWVLGLVAIVNGTLMITTGLDLSKKAKEKAA